MFLRFSQMHRDITRPQFPNSVCPWNFALVREQRSDVVHPYTLEELLDAYSGYPKRIQTAILRARTHPTITSALTKSAISVLIALLTRASMRNGQAPLKARIDRLAAEASVSTKTVQRTIASLRELGWMTLPTDDGRNSMGEFTYRVYQFTSELCRLLDLPCSNTEAQAIESEDKTKMSDGGVYVDLTYKKDQQRISLQKHKGTPVVLPPELDAACTEFQVNKTGMAKLRGLAHSAGHDLAAIILVARAYLHKSRAKGHRVYRYLETMMQKAVDYSARAQQVLRTQAETDKSGQVRSLQAKYRHKQFVGPAGLKVRVFDGIAEVTNNGQVNTVVGAALEKVFAAIKTGTLVPAEGGICHQTQKASQSVVVPRTSIINATGTETSASARTEKDRTSGRVVCSQLMEMLRKQTRQRRAVAV